MVCTIKTCNQENRDINDNKKNFNYIHDDNNNVIDDNADDYEVNDDNDGVKRVIASVLLSNHEKVLNIEITWN